jgi:hypothetical protein
VVVAAADREIAGAAATGSVESRAATATTATERRRSNPRAGHRDLVMPDGATHAHPDTGGKFAPLPGR